MRRAIHSLNLSKPLSTHLPLINIAIFLCFTLFLAANTFAAVQPGTCNQGKAFDRASIVRKTFGLQIPFIANQGQSDKQVHFYAQTFGGKFYITESGELVYTLSIPDSREKVGRHSKAQKRVKILSIREQFIGGSRVDAEGIDRTPTKINYFSGNDRNNWKTDIPTYDTVSLGDIYTGIGLSLKAYGDNVEKIFVVQPGADINAIRIKIDGADTLGIKDNGELEIKLPHGVIRFSEPRAYQEKSGKRQSVHVAYSLKGETYGFKAAGYDPALPLIIDPCLVYSGHIGGSSDDIANGIAAGPNGSIYITGSTYSSDFHVTDNSSNEGAWDAFVTKLIPDGDTYVIDFSTYLGGSLDDFGYGIAVDSAGNAVVTGETWSPDFPTLGAFQKKIGGDVDAWVTRMTSSGDLDYATYLGGGGGSEAGYAVVLDSAGKAYVTGVTQAANFPVTPGAAFTKSNGKTNAFISKLNFSSPKISLEASTFLGGNGDDAGYALALNNGTIFVTGKTDSADFWQAGAALSTALSGLTDGFLTTFDDALTTVPYSTYVGGNGEDACEGIALDNLSNIFLTGSTTSTAGFPGCIGCTLLGSSDAFVLQLYPNNGDDYVVGFSSFVGGSNEDAAYGIAVNTENSILITGETNSSDLPLTEDSSYGGGYDAFMTKLVPDNERYAVAFSTYFGGASDDVSNGISLDPSGNVYIAGSTYGFEEEDSNFDAFIAVIADLDSDADGIADRCDNCPDVANGPLAGTCSTDQTTPCSEDLECGSLGYCSKNQEDWDEDGTGDACDSDDDNDGLDDTWEDQYGGEGGFSLNPYDTDSDDDGIPDGDEDFDAGGLPNRGEEDAGSNPYLKDTDGDHWTDLWEVQLNTSAVNPSDSPNAATVFADGVFVDKLNGDDVNLGNGDNPVRSIHAAFDRIERFELGSSEPIEISVTADTYSIGDPEPDEPLMTSQNVIIQGAGVTVNGAGGTSWTQGFVFSPLSSNVTINGLYILSFNEAVVFNSDGGCATFNSVNISACQTGLQLAEAYQLGVDLTTSMISGCQTGVEFAAESSNNSISNGSIQDNALEAVKVSGGSGNQLVNTAINGPGAYGLKIEMGVTGFAISGGSIQDTDVGIGFATDGASLTVSDASIQNCRAGIEFLENYMISVELAGTTISSCDAGILFTASSSSNAVLNGTVQENTDGIRFERCADDPDSEAPGDNQIIGTTVSNNTNYGITIVAGSGNQLDGVTISGSDTGVYMGSDSSSNILQGGSVSGNNTNFNLDGSENTIEGPMMLQKFGQISGKGNELIDITLSGPSVNGQPTEPYGLYLDQGSEEIILQNVTIQNYDVGIGFATDAACIRFIGQTHIQDCRIGIDIRENYMLDIDLGNTVISTCDTGIEIAEGSSNNTVRNGTVELNSGDGILVDGCAETPDDNRIIGTTVQNNGRNGIALFAGFGNEVIGCTITGNNSGQTTGGFGGVNIMNGSGAVKTSRIYNNGCTGVYLDDSAVANISGNLIHGNPEGIRVALASEVSISSNTITANADAGIVIEDGALPLIKYNILYGNGTGSDTSTDVSLEGDFEPTNMVENDIGTLNQIDLPPTNLSVEPLFCVDDFSSCDAPSEDYSLQRTSLCIDGTTVTEPGMDLTGSSRPKGDSWDMGAIETSSFRDADDDGLPDPWEEFYFGGSTDCPTCGADDDYDGDGISNLQEYLEGANPDNPVYVRIINPAPSPYFTNNGSITISGTSINADSITVTNGVTSGIESWSADISLADGGNVILVTAEGTVTLPNYTGDYTATDTITVVKDSATPTVSIIGPTTEGTYTTTLQSITLSGLANDDTEVASVSWAVVGDPQNGSAKGTISWTAGPILLPQVSADPVSITVRITATDIYGKTGSEDIVITRVPGANNVDEDLSDQGSEPSADDPLDVDSDRYLNDDEIACGSDPLNDPDSGLQQTPPNYGNTSYPAGHEKEGYLWPDCLNPDIDGDGLPNWWEEEYFTGSPTGALPEIDDDGDGLNNLQEYEGGTNPTVAQTIAFSLTATDTGSGDGLPEFGKTFRVQAMWTDSSPAPAQAVFSLRMTSNYPGRAENDPNPADMEGGGNYPAWYDYHGPDFGLTSMSSPDCNTIDCFNQGSIIVADSGGGNYEVYLHSWDYGGRTKVLVTDPVSGNYLGQLWVPVNSDKNGISSAWITYYGDPTGLDPNADTDTIAFNGTDYSAPRGDDFTHFEEYRGIIYTSTVGGALQHMRLNPLRKDLFIRGAGFHGDYNFTYGPAFENAGIDVHDTTSWGHDATEDGSFFVYYRQGNITTISGNVVNGAGTNWSSAWPRHEWEFELNGEEVWMPISYWSATGEELGLDFAYDEQPTAYNSYRVRKPVPHINVLIIRHDPTGVFGSPDGHIRFVSASPPSQQNPSGTRYWRWATKGYAWCQTTANQASMYGLAVTLQTPLYNYFNDTPYVDGSTWGNSWGLPDSVLNPLSIVEDQTDQLDPIDGVMGDEPDGTWDGDFRLASSDDWSGGDLNPFDINNNNLVELPLATDPTSVDSNNEYDLSHVLMHTITHEMAHALAGPSHTNDPLCLMYRYSNNWSRHHHLSDYYKSLLRIHNIVR